MSRFLLAPAFIAAIVSPLQGQAKGLLVVAHGADSGWNAGVREVVRQVEWNGPVELAWLMGSEASTQSWEAAMGRLESQRLDSVVVVPLMVSSHGAHTRQIQHYAGKLAELPAVLAGHAHAHVSPPKLPVRVTSALDAAPELGQILLSRWRDRDARDRRRPVVLVAHGPTSDEDATAWVDALLHTAAPLAEALGDKAVRVGLLRDDAPPPQRALAVAAIRDTITALSARHGDSVLVMTVLISTGGINRVKVPADLAGMPMRYAGVVLSPHPLLARWIERVAKE